MLYLREFKQNPDRLSDLLPWAALVAKGVVLNKDGSFQATLKFRGPDLDSSTEGELVSISARLNNVLRRLGSGWAIYVEAKRFRSRGYPESNFPDALSFLLNEERKLQFERESYFESSYFLSLVYLPPADSKNKVEAFFLDTKLKGKVNYQHILDGFQAEVGRVHDLLSQVFPEVVRLHDEEILTYLHSLISGKLHRVSVPNVPMYIDAYLSDTPLTSGFEPKLGSKYLKVISIRSFPSTSLPGLLDRLNRLSISYRWVTRFIALDKPEAEREISKYKKRWFSKRKGILTLLKETLTGSMSVMEDSDAINKAHDADEALQELQDDAVSYGYFTQAIVLSGEDLEALENEVREVERVINGLGFVSRVEDVNAVDAWLGTLPGNCRNNVRRPLLNTINLSHLMPLSAVWAGEDKDKHFKGPPLLIAKTNGSTEFRFVPHVGDVGHTLVIGPTGAGKSVLINALEAQFLKYDNAQVYIFDKGGSARTLTYGLGGEYYSLGADSADLCFQPLQRIDEPKERRWALDWLTDILIQEKVSVTPDIKEDLWVALNSLASAPKVERTLFGFTVLLQNVALRQALLPYTIQGPYGHLLDNCKDTLSYAHFQCFEMEVLMETPSVLLPVLSYLFHRLGERFTGSPTLLVLDEAWAYLDNEAFAQKIREWLKVLRKANVMVLFATQSIADVEQSKISATIKEACFTKIYLPNQSSLNEDLTAFYKKFGLNERQIRILAESTPKRDYYYTSPLGNRLFELSLGELELAYYGATSKESQVQTKQSKGSATSTEDFNARYLQALGLELHAKAYEEVVKGRMAA